MSFFRERVERAEHGLSAAGLHWEFCCLPNALPAIAELCAKFPDTLFVLDHLGHNCGGEDFASWAPAITELAKRPNVCAKLGAIEEWQVADPGPFLDHAIQAFGYDRVIYESNWFVNAAMGHTYEETLKLVEASCKRLGASDEETDLVFAANARRVYRLA